MSQLLRASMQRTRLISVLRPPSAVAPKPFSTEASEASPGSLAGLFSRTPPTDSSPVYGRLLDVSKHTTKSDIVNLMDASNLSPEKIKVQYNPAYLPLSMLLEFPSAESFEAAFRSIARKGRQYNLRRADKNEWDASTAYDGKSVVLLGLPRNANFDDIDRFLFDCQHDASSIQITVRLINGNPIRMALLHFPTQALAMHAYITKNRNFCLNTQITVQVLQ